MKTTINREELISYEACEEGLLTFTEKHGDSTVKLSECFESNTLDDVFWLLEELENRNLLSNSQIKDLRLYAADCAESVLHIFEKEYPNDNRPRLAIQATRDFVNGLIDRVTLIAARDAAWVAACAVASSAVSAAARYSARDAAWVAARSAAWAEQSKRLKDLVVSWEHKDDE